MRQGSRGMGRRRLMLAGLVVVAWFGLTARPAPAAPAQEPPAPPPVTTPVAPATPCTAGATGELPVGCTPPPAGCPGSSAAGPPSAGTVCPDGSNPLSEAANARVRDLLGLDEEGESHSISSYDIGCDEGAWNNLTRRFWCMTQAGPYAFGKWVLGLSIDVLGWALEFRIAEGLTPVAGQLAQVYRSGLVGPLRVEHLAWFATLWVGGWHLMRARSSRGISEIASTFVVGTVAAMVLANPSGYLAGSVELTQQSSGAVLEALNGTLRGDQPGPTSADGIRDELKGVMRRSFIAEPYDLINWGSRLEGACAEARDQILEGGPWGSDDEPRNRMRAAGCEAEADFNARPNDTRAASSIIVCLVQVGVGVLIMLMGLFVFAAQLALLGLFAGAPIALTVAQFPGARGVLWWWLSKLVWALLGTVASMLVLSLLALSSVALLNATEDISIVQRCLIVLVLVAVGFRFRTQVNKATSNLANRLGDKIRNATPGDSGAGWGALAVSGAGGLGMGAADGRPPSRRAGRDAGGDAGPRLGRGYDEGGGAAAARARGAAGGDAARRGATAAGAADRVRSALGGSPAARRAVGAISTGAQGTVAAASLAGRAAKAVATAPLRSSKVDRSRLQRAQQANERLQRRLEAARKQRDKWEKEAGRRSGGSGAKGGKSR